MRRLIPCLAVGVALLGLGAIVCFLFVQQRKEVGELQSFKSEMDRWVASQGTDILQIQRPPDRDIPPGSSAPPALCPSDSEELSRRCHSLRFVSPVCGFPGHLAFSGPATDNSVHAVGPQYFSVTDLEITEGAPFTETDLKKENRVCVMSASLSKALFGNQSPVGKSVSLEWVQDHEWRDVSPHDYDSARDAPPSAGAGGYRYVVINGRGPSTFTVVGVYERRNGYRDSRDSIVYIPWTTASRLAEDGAQSLGWTILAKAVDEGKLSDAVRECMGILRELRKSKAGQADYYVEDRNQSLADWSRSHLADHEAAANEASARRVTWCIGIAVGLIALLSIVFLLTRTNKGGSTRSPEEAGHK